MIKRARRRWLGDPSPAEIRRLTAQIRQKWSVEECARRAGIKPKQWLPPLFQLSLLGDAVVELDLRGAD